VCVLFRHLCFREHGDNAPEFSIHLIPAVPIDFHCMYTRLCEWIPHRLLAFTAHNTCMSRPLALPFPFVFCDAPLPPHPLVQSPSIPQTSLQLSLRQSLA
jgi:hypothetical protein